MRHEVTGMPVRMTFRRSGITSGWAALCCVMLFGCPSSDKGAKDAGASDTGTAGSGAPAAKWSEIYPMLFPMATNPRCNACHAMPANDIANGNLFVGPDQDSAYAALVNKKSTSTRCMSKMLVVPKKPDESLMLQKLSPNPPCGSRMPIGGTPFTDTQLEMIRSWIAGGAKND